MRVIADELDRKEAALEALQNSDSADNVDVELQVFAFLDLQSKTRAHGLRIEFWMADIFVELT